KKEKRFAQRHGDTENRYRFFLCVSVSLCEIFLCCFLETYFWAARGPASSAQALASATKRIDRSTACTCLVSAPIEMRSTPVSATSRTLASVTPPEASTRVCARLKRRYSRAIATALV